MLTIWKYPIPIQDKFILSVPKGARVLAVQTQYGEPMIWMLVDPTVEKCDMRFTLVGTGHSVPADKYIGTFQFMGGNLVFHLFVESSDGQG